MANGNFKRRFTKSGAGKYILEINSKNAKITFHSSNKNAVKRKVTKIFEINGKVQRLLISPHYSFALLVFHCNRFGVINLNPWKDKVVTYGQSCATNNALWAINDQGNIVTAIFNKTVRVYQPVHGKWERCIMQPLDQDLIRPTGQQVQQVQINQRKIEMLWRNPHQEIKFPVPQHNSQHQAR